MPSKIEILGNKIDCFSSYRDLYNYVCAALAMQPSSGYVTVNNVHTLMEGHWKKTFRRIINSSWLSIPDGKPLEVVGRLKGNKEIKRLFGPTLMEYFIDWGRKDALSHCFFGSSEDVLRKLQAEIELKFPGTRIACMIAPPYKPFNEWDNAGFIDAINKAKADIIWVGLGAPKQEQWMYEHAPAIKQGLMFGIGAGFDYLAGNTKHAPEWMKNASLEWLYRLLQEPGRLWKRYVTIIPPFLFYALLELLGMPIKGKEK